MYVCIVCYILYVYLLFVLYLYTGFYLRYTLRTYKSLSSQELGNKTISSLTLGFFYLPNSSVAPFFSFWFRSSKVSHKEGEL